jgi:hypothetical protein
VGSRRLHPKLSIEQLKQQYPQLRGSASLNASTAAAEYRASDYPTTLPYVSKEKKTPPRWSERNRTRE